MSTGPQKVVNRPAPPVVSSTLSPAAARPSGPESQGGAGPTLKSPAWARLTSRFAGIQSALARQPADAAERGVYCTSEGQLVELPADMSVVDAATLEVQALNARQKLGKGAPPRPVPAVRQPPVKGPAGRKPITQSRGRRTASSRGPGGAAAAKAAALLQAVGKGPVAKYLAVRGLPVLSKGVLNLNRQKLNEQTHDTAATKLQQSVQAVVHPPSEGQSKSNAGQVNVVSQKPAPVADERKGKQKLEESLAENIPKSLEDVDNFKQNRKAQHMGAAVLAVVQSDKNAVTSTFGEMEQTPAPAPAEHTPVELPPEEIAPATPAMNLGDGAIAPLLKEHTDVSRYTSEADRNLAEEGVTQEQLDLVDSGPLAEANREKKGLEQAARTQPAAVQQFARQESQGVSRDLRQEEKVQRDGLRQKRKAGLGATRQRQSGAKLALAKKRDEVALKINSIFTTAQNSVKKKLADLEASSMKRFDEGQARATKEFEDTVERELDAFKEDRYSGFWGKAKKAKDWLLGMDDLPEVKAIFDRNRARFVDTINRLVEQITADNRRVIQECKNELAIARTTIKELVDNLEPGLKDIGRKAAEEMGGKLDELDQFVGRKEQELQQSLKDKQTAAIRAIDEKIEKMKEAMAGALAKLGKLLLLAAKKFFTWALQKFGYSLEEIEGIINRGAAVLKAIFTKPIQFVKNLVRSAMDGFQSFAKNFLVHLKDAIFEWLTGSLEGIQLPSSWTLRGIASVALQMLRITYQNLRGKLVKATSESAVKSMESGFDLVVSLVKEGPVAAWEKLSEMAEDIKAAFIEGVTNFLQIKVVQKAIETIVSMFIPGAGIVRAVVGIYDTVVFFIQKAKQIAKMVSSFLSSIAEIAAGNLSAAAAALENGLARALSLVISFLAKFLRLDGVTAKIRAAIQKLGDKVDGILDRVVEWIVKKASRLGGRVSGRSKDGETVSVRGQVVRAVMAGLSEERTQEEVEAHLQTVRSRFAPRGLQRLEIGTPDGRGNLPILVQASPVAPEVLLELAPERAVVSLVATIRFRRPASLQIVTRPTSIHVEGDSPGFVHAAHQAGVTVVSPDLRKDREPPAMAGTLENIRSSVFQAVAYNTPGQNTERHAEDNFGRWFLKEFRGSLGQLESLQIHVTHSPCAVCSVEGLESFAGQVLAGFENQRTQGTSTPIFQLHYERPFTSGERATTVEDLAALAHSTPAWIITSGRAVTLTRAQREKRSRERRRARIIGQSRLK